MNPLVVSSNPRRPAARLLIFLVMAFLSFGSLLAFRQAVWAQTGLSFTTAPYVNPAKITENSAVIYWITSQEASTVVWYGKTPQLESGSQRDIDLMTGDSVSVLIHNFVLGGLEADTTYYFKAQSSDGTNTISSDVGQFHTLKPAVVVTACTESIWSCGAWGACSTDGVQTRTCAKAATANCAGGVSHAAAENQKCAFVPPSCAESDWSCGQWGACSFDGVQIRTCSKKTSANCTGGVSHKATESQQCEYVPPVPVNEPAPPEQPQAVCGNGQCEAGETYASCPHDCTPPNETLIDVNAPPASDQQPPGTNEPGGGQGSAGNGQASLLEQRIQDLVGGGSGQGGATFTPSGVPKDPNQPDLPSGENGQPGGGGIDPLCLENDISASRCAIWLEAKFADKTCLDVGKMTKESCEAYLTDKNGGTFPGCEGKTSEECQKIKDLTTLGYLPSDTRTQLDQVIAGAVHDNVVVSVVGVTAVSPEGAQFSAWWKSQTTAGSETSPVVTVQDSDHDGLPDDVERRLGSDPNKADTDGDGINDGDALRRGLNPLGGGKAVIHLGPIDRAITSGLPLGQPLGAGEVDNSFHVDAGTAGGPLTASDPNAPPPVEPSGVTLSGTCVPNSVCLIYIYSYIPMVLTVATDENGNFNVDLGKSVVDGEHTVYVAMADENGTVTAKSDPISLFVKAAKAATKDEFLQPDVSAPKTPPSVSYFLMAAFGVIVVGVLAVYMLVIRRKTAGLPPKAGA